ncbi:MAG: flagellar hook basal-body protein [Syntrophobacteraceae bacterium]
MSASNSLYTALAGLNTFNTAISVASNDIANANTTGFKSSSVDFGQLVSGLTASTTTCSGTDFTAGTAIQTGIWSDLMIQGNGFFAVENPTSSLVSYTQDGSFQLNSTGFLVDANGNEVLDDKGKAIQVATPGDYTSFAVDQFGNLTGTNSSGTPTPLGVIGITTFANQNGLISTGQNDFIPGANVGTTTTQAAGSGNAGTIASGSLEGSNVDLTQEMVNLIDYQNDYQACSKAITADSGNLQAAVNLIR